jgi:hypothetical protein
MPRLPERTRPDCRPSCRLTVERLEDRCLLSGGDFTLQPILPHIDPGMKAYLQSILARGVQMGNQPYVFSKVGDSITAAPQFLDDLGRPTYNPYDPGVTGAYGYLAPTIDYFRAQPIDAWGANSFDHLSWAATPGWTAAAVLNPAANLAPPRSAYLLPTETPEAGEFRLTQPGIALIMLGTNDLLDPDPEAFRGALMTVTVDAINDGVIPVLSTIPPSLINPNVNVYNQIIADVAADLDVPLWNYWLALQPLPSSGISVDLKHPSVYPGGSGFFTPLALQYGYNVRNLTAVQVLDKLLHVVIQNGAPDPPDGVPPPQAYQFVAGLYQSVLGRAPDPFSLQNWALATQVISRQGVAQAIWNSPEHRDDEVQQYYATYLHRPATAAEVAGWEKVMRAGMSEDQVQAAILASAEFTAGQGSNESFVAALYQDVLGRDPDPAGAAGWLNFLNRGVSRYLLAQWFLASSERYDHVVNTLYGGILHRQPTPAEEQGWLTQLQDGLNTPEGVGEAMLTSYEFWVTPHA